VECDSLPHLLHAAKRNKTLRGFAYVPTKELLRPASDCYEAVFQNELCRETNSEAMRFESDTGMLVWTPLDNAGLCHVLFVETGMSMVRYPIRRFFSLSRRVLYLQNREWTGSRQGLTLQDSRWRRILVSRCAVRVLVRIEHI